jgi:hypothetical protein
MAWIKIINKFIAAFSILMLMLHCDLYRDKDYQVSDEDAHASQVLSDTSAATLVKIATVNLTSYKAAWVDSVVADSVDSILSALKKDGIILKPNEKNYQITSPADLMENYIALETTNGSITAYVSNFVAIKLIKKSGAIIESSDATIKAETVHACPMIKTRLVFNGIGETVLLQLTKSDETVKDKFFIAVF